ncbi:unnamed protein product [Durusdinium trenchii]|uniref:Deacetylase sirtuin-type domain-containing protein n=1 Tax=Durusdinium trenchii TaxID=1381693 RepID=A0ABP0NF53_9DINO
MVCRTHVPRPREASRKQKCSFSSMAPGGPPTAAWRSMRTWPRCRSTRNGGSRTRTFVSHIGSSKSRSSSGDSGDNVTTTTASRIRTKAMRWCTTGWGSSSDTRRSPRSSSSGAGRKLGTRTIRPYEVKGRAGAFHVFTSNVDAHHYDWFPACEIRECHGNTEIYQCAGSRSMGGLRDMDERCPGIWRAPLEYRFHVDKETMLAPKEAPEEAFEVETNHWAPPQGDEDPMSTVPRVGRVTGSARRHTLRFMRSGAVVAESPASAAKRGFAANHPVCPECGGPARPAILMFGDYSWRDNDAQEDRWETWLDQVNDLATERTADFNPLRVALLEVGAGNNVTTVRSRSEHILRDLVEKGAEAKLLRVNPDFPLVGNRRWVRK